VILRLMFQPGGGYPFFSVPAAALVDRAVPLCDLWGNRANSLLDELVHAATNSQRRGGVAGRASGKVE
jgi:hypothetical protein